MKKRAKNFINSISAVVVTAIFLSVTALGIGASADTNKPYYGDVDADGEVLLADAVILQKNVVKLVELDGDQILRGDVNADKVISMKDVVLIQRYIAKLIEEFPAEQQWNFQIDSDGYINGFF